MKRTLWIMGLVVQLAVAQPATATGEFSLSERDLKTVETGQVVVQVADSQESTAKDIQCVGLVKADADTVWSILLDSDHYKKMFPHVVKSEVRRRGEGFEDHYTLVNYPWPYGERWTVNRITFAPDHRTISWHRIDGTIKEVVGSWHLIPRGDETLVVYRIRFDPGIANVPSWAIDWGTQRVAPDIIHALQREVRQT